MRCMNVVGARASVWTHQHRPPSRRSRRGLDWFVFFVADVQTGFGPVHRGLPDIAEVDPDRHRLRPHRGRADLAVRADPRRRPARSPAIAPARSWNRGRHHLRERADPCAVADVSGRDALAHPAGRRELRAGPGDRGPQPRPRAALACRRTVRPQRGVCLGRHRPRGRSDGRLRLLFFQPGRVLRHGPARHSGADRADADQAERHQCDTLARRRRR